MEYIENNSIQRKVRDNFLRMDQNQGTRKSFNGGNFVLSPCPKIKIEKRLLLNRRKRV